MNKKIKAISIATSIIVAGASISLPSGAQASEGYSALGDAQAQPMTAEQLAGTTGQLNAYDIAAALTAEAAKLAKYPKLQAADLKIAADTLANAVAINAFFQKLGILTPCKSCGH